MMIADHCTNLTVNPSNLGRYLRIITQNIQAGAEVYIGIRALLSIRLLGILIPSVIKFGYAELLSVIARVHYLDKFTIVLSNQSDMLTQIT